MTEFLIIEDEAEKRSSIENEIRDYFGDPDIKICVAQTFAEAAKLIFERRFDLIVTDLMLPRRPGDKPSDFSDNLLDFLSGSSLNSSAVVVAISQFGDLIERQATSFKRLGIFLLDYNNQSDWRTCLKICLQRVEHKQAIDFAIICALEEERVGFREVQGDVTYGELSRYHGLDCRDISIAGFNGICVVQPRMGLVDAAAICAQVLSLFRPRLVCMAGICAGFEGEVELGTLLVSDPTWEHQSGKWKGEEFKLSHYQEPLRNSIRTILSQLIEADPSCQELTADLPKLYRSLDRAAAIMPTVSGSAVIASSDKAGEIREQHRKVGGLDMEVYGLYRAAALHSEDTMCFAAKTVVDLANEAKGDDLHHAGAVFSARFVAKAIQRILSD